MDLRPDTTVILGAGLTGCCTELELVRRGHEVILVYANDRTLTTGLPPPPSPAPGRSSPATFPPASGRRCS